MTIAANKAVSIDYTLTNDAGEVIDSSAGGAPLVYLQGAGNIIPGLETAMMDKEAGESFGVDVKSADAYGERREGLSQRVPKKHFGNTRLVPGQQVILQTNFGPRAVTVEKVGMTVVDVDLNHPMAGKTLNFDVEVVSVRDVTPEDLQGGCSCGDCGDDCGGGCDHGDGHCDCH